MIFLDEQRRCITCVKGSKDINVVASDPNIFLWITASVAAAAAVNPNDIKMLFADTFNTFFIKDNPVFNNGPKSLPRNLPDCSILCNWVFYNFILADKSFEKALRSLETCVLVNNSLCRKLFSSLESWWKLQSYLSTIFYS